MKPLVPLRSVLLGDAVRSEPLVSCGLTPDGTRWWVKWLNAAGECRETTAPVGSGDWSDSVVIHGGRITASSTRDGNLTSGVLCQTKRGNDVFALRSGRRVIGTRPTFPGASLVLSRQAGAEWIDLAFADDTPDARVLAATMAVQGDQAVAVYLVAEERNEMACRALRFSLTAVGSPAGMWRRGPDFPLSPGVAAPITGMHGDVLIAAGGANFPDRPPWENGVKRTYDEIFALLPGETVWRRAGRLPAPRAYAAVVSVPEGVLAIAGENASGVFQDSLLLSWNGREVVVKSAPALPVPLASPAAVVLDGKVYLAGGYAAGAPRVSTAGFYCLDLADLAAGWRSLVPWPGPSRALTVMAALNGAIYLVSGLEMRAGPDGQPQMSYLTDAYRYRPDMGWSRLPDLPWSAVAAPSPAPVTSAPERIFVFGGVDGRQVGKVPRDQRVPEDILYFDVARREWLLWPEPWPEPIVSAPTTRQGAEWIFVSGETKAGHRTTAVMAWRPPV